MAEIILTGDALDQLRHLPPYYKRCTPSKKKSPGKEPGQTQKQRYTLSDVEAGEQSFL